MEDYKSFVFWFVGLVGACTILLALVTYGLFGKDLPYTENDLVRQYQIHKLTNIPDIQLLVVGDSSAGNAIDAALLSSLTGVHAENVALTGSFGIEGSTNMIRQALHAGQPVRYVLVVETLDIWHRSYPEQGIIDTSRGLPDDPEFSFSRATLWKYLFNPKQIQWAVNFYLHEPIPFVISNDYRKQNADTYASGVRIVTNAGLPTEIDSTKQKAITDLGRLCLRERLICVYAHGPLHENVALQSQATLAAVNALLARVPGLAAVPDLPTFPNQKIGDSIDHVAPAFKQESTRIYAQMLALFLKVERK